MSDEKVYQVTLEGKQPLILHRDNVEWQDQLKTWETDPANKKVSVKGDDRSPAWRWMGCLYVEKDMEDDGKDKLVIHCDNLMTMLREGGKLCPTGKRQGTFKSQSQSGIIVDSLGWPIQVGSARAEIEYSDIAPLLTETDFSVHCKACAELGIELFVKRAAVGTSKHVRVRPMFKTWWVSGRLLVVDPTITKAVLSNILTHAGRYAGMGDWRPSAPKGPGRFGTFALAELKEVK